MPPASRISDQVGIPTTIGVIVQGSPNVLIGNLMAAREGDVALVGNSPDRIERGELSVHINNHEAARVRDPLIKGPKIRTGMDTVLIGPDEILPCDVDTLTVEVLEIAGPSGDGSPPPSPIIATIPRKLIGAEPVPEGVPDDVVGLLGTYDVVVDVVAGFRTEENSHDVIDNSRSFEAMTAEEQLADSQDYAGAVRISASSTYHMSCSRRLHPRMLMTPVSPAEELPKTLDERAARLPSQKFHAAPLTLDFNQDGGLNALFQFIRYIFGGTGAKQILVEAQGCGGRAPNAGPANEKLSALVRIFRKDTWELEVKLPPLRDYSYSKERNYTGPDEGTKTETTDKTLGPEGIRETRTSTQVSSNETSTSTTTLENGKGQEETSTTTTKPDGSTKRTDTLKVSGEGQVTGVKKGDGPENLNFAYEKTLAKKGENLVEGGGLTISLLRNGQPLAIDLLNLVERVAKELYGLKKNIRDALEALRQGPQIGWKLAFSFAFLEGSIKFEWEPETGQPIGGRYWPTVIKGTVVVKLLILKIEVEVSFGLELKVWKLAEVTAKVYFKASGKLETDFTVTLAQSEKGAERDLKLTIEGELGFTVEVSVVGWSLLDVSGSASAGIELLGKLGVSTEKGMYLSASAKRTEAVAKIHVSGPFGVLWSKRHTLWSEAPLMQPINL